MSRTSAEDLFSIQTRLFRMFQVKRELSAKEAAEIFDKFDVFGYIATCYDIYHVQGDETNLNDMEQYVIGRGWRS